jgi:antitoxin VapB
VNRQGLRAQLHVGDACTKIHTLVYTHGGDVETLTTRVFNNGNSQAVRIPAEFRLDTDRVSISRNESGDLVIHPLRAERGAALFDALRAVGEADVAFIAALETERARQQPLQERDAL